MSASEKMIQIPQISLEEQERYKGKHVAIVDGKVVAVGRNSIEVFRKAKELFPDKSTEEILLDYIPREEVLIL